MKKRLTQEEINIALAGGVPEGRTKAWAAGLRRRLKVKAEKDAAKAKEVPQTEENAEAPEVHAAESVVVEQN